MLTGFDVGVSAPNYNRINVQSGTRLLRDESKQQSCLLDMKLCFMSSGLVSPWPLQFLCTGFYNRSYGGFALREVSVVLA